MLNNHLILLPHILLFACLQILIFSSEACTLTPDLTSQELARLSSFTSASYVPSEKQESLRNAYQSLNRTLGNYFIEIDQTYQFNTNDIHQCQQLPDYLTFNSMDDVWMCTQPLMVLECNKEWQLKIGCGTFIELHKPFDTAVIAQIRLSQAMVDNGALSMTLTNVCAGTYHLWFVYSVRAGKVIKNIKPIFVSSPACTCS